jgi:hypothetical protein
MDYQQQYPADIPLATNFEPTLPPAPADEKPAPRHRHHARHTRKTSPLPSRAIATALPTSISLLPAPSLPPLVEIDSVYITARSNSREQILRSTYDAYFVVWKNQLDSAKNILGINVARQNQYKLEHDSSINDALQELRKRIQEKECFNLQAEYNNCLNRALNYCKRAEFIFADDQLKRAHEILHANQSCQWNDSLYESTLKKYEPAITWSRKKAAYESALQQKDYVGFIGLYKESQTIFDENTLENLYLKQVSISEFLLEQNDPQLVADICQSLVESGKPEQGLNLMKLLKGNKSAQAGLKKHQQKIGILLAKTYPIKTDKPDWLNNYLHDPWFKSMTNSYLRACKRLPLPFLFL